MKIDARRRGKENSPYARGDKLTRMTAITPKDFRGQRLSLAVRSINSGLPMFGFEQFNDYQFTGNLSYNGRFTANTQLYTRATVV